MANAAGWDPSTNPVHRLILVCDVMAITFHAFRQTCLRHVGKQSREDVEKYGKRAPIDAERISEFRSILAGIKQCALPVIHEDEWPKSAKELGHYAIVCLPERNTNVVGAIRGISEWLMVVAHKEFPLAPSSDRQSANDTRNQHFDEQGELIRNYAVHRAKLIDCLAEVGIALPSAVHRGVGEESFQLEEPNGQYLDGLLKHRLSEWALQANKTNPAAVASNRSENTFATLPAETTKAESYSSKPVETPQDSAIAATSASPAPSEVATNSELKPQELLAEGTIDHLGKLKELVQKTKLVLDQERDYWWSGHCPDGWSWRQREDAENLLKPLFTVAVRTAIDDRRLWYRDAVLEQINQHRAETLKRWLSLGMDRERLLNAIKCVRDCLRSHFDFVGYCFRYAGLLPGSPLFLATERQAQLCGSKPPEPIKVDDSIHAFLGSAEHRQNPVVSAQRRDYLAEMSRLSDEYTEAMENIEDLQTELLHLESKSSHSLTQSDQSKNAAMVPPSPAAIGTNVSTTPAVSDHLKPKTPPSVGDGLSSKKAPVIPPSPAEVYLANWTEIFNALNEGHPKPVHKNTETSRKRILKLNNEYSGPIVKPNGKGTQPRVVKKALLDWWRSLRDVYVAGEEEKTKDTLSARETLSEMHDYGTDGKVVPLIGGGVKKRKGNQAG